MIDLQIGCVLRGGAELRDFGEHLLVCFKPVVNSAFSALHSFSNVTQVLEI